MSPRPLNSLLDLTKIQATGFTPEPALDALRRLPRALTVP